jgi:hypothetical protein
MPPTIVRLRRINGPQNQALSWLCRQHLRRCANGKIARLSPPDQEALRDYRLGRVRAQLKAHDYAGIILADPLNTRYATDSINMQLWCAHNAVRYVFIATEGPVIVFEFHGSQYLSNGLRLVDETRPAVA